MQEVIRTNTLILVDGNIILINYELTLCNTAFAGLLPAKLSLERC